MNEQYDPLLDEFREKAEALGVIVVRVALLAEAATAIGQWAEDIGADRVIVSSEVAAAAGGIVNALREAGVAITPPGSPEQMRDAPLGISLGRLAVAETGSMLLAEPGLEDRAVGMLSLAQVIVCRTASLVVSLDSAAVELRRLALKPGSSFATLVTGPSRTADIERVLTVGVQGPGKIMNLFVDDL